MVVRRTEADDKLAWTNGLQGRGAMEDRCFLFQHNSPYLAVY